jgi:hypothetical protein
MKKWTEFDPATGRIGQTVQGGDALVIPPETSVLGVLLDLIVDAQVSYVDVNSRQAVDRPATSIQLSQSGNVLTLTGVKMDTVLEVSGDLSELITQDDASGSVQVTINQSGSYLLRAEQFPELSFIATVNVA